MTAIWTAFLIVNLAAASAAWLAALLHERDIRPLRRLAAACRRPIGELAFVAVVAVGFIQSGSTKGTNGMPSRGTSLSPHGQVEEMVEMEPVLRGETGDVPEAVTNADWLAFGAYEDWFHITSGDWCFRFGTNLTDRLVEVQWPVVFGLDEVSVSATEKIYALRVSPDFLGGTVRWDGDAAGGPPLRAAPRLRAGGGCACDGTAIEQPDSTSGWNYGYMYWQNPFGWNHKGTTGMAAPFGRFATATIDEFYILFDGTMSIKKLQNMVTRMTNDCVYLNGVLQ